jgi:hypothetical protein
LRGHCIMSDRASANPETQSNSLARSAEQSPKAKFGMRKNAGREAGWGGQRAKTHLSAPLMLANAPRISWLVRLSSLVRALHCVEARCKAGL